MQDWLQILVTQGWFIDWECDRCLRETRPEDMANSIERSVQGFFQSGKEPRSRTDPDYDWDRPRLKGCMRCGCESNFLQLVLRRRR